MNDRAMAIGGMIIMGIVIIVVMPTNTAYALITQIITAIGSLVVGAGLGLAWGRKISASTMSPNSKEGG